MSEGLLARKLGMTSYFTDDGSHVPVTILQTGPCTVLYKRTMEKDKYSAIALGFETVRKDSSGAPRLNKPDAARFKKLGVEPAKHIREFRLKPEAAAKYEVGQQLKLDTYFKKGMLVDVAGMSKGRGFEGVMKRHHMKGAARDSSTAHEHHRHIGAVGQRKTPGKVWKNKRLPGHLGHDNVTQQNIEVVEIDLENNFVLVAGSVPGHKRDLVTIHPAVKGQPKRGSATTASTKSAKSAKPAAAPAAKKK